MKIIKKTYTFKRHFEADMKCEFCGRVERGVWGYDDLYFHHVLVPNMHCTNCGKVSGKATSQPRQTDFINSGGNPMRDKEIRILSELLETYENRPFTLTEDELEMTEYMLIKSVRPLLEEVKRLKEAGE